MGGVWPRLSRLLGKNKELDTVKIISDSIWTSHYVWCRLFGSMRLARSRKLNINLDVTNYFLEVGRGQYHNPHQVQLLC